MKFAKYLKDTHTPEWKKAYIDYRGLEVQLKAIRSRPTSSFLSSSLGNTTLNPAHYPNPHDEEKCSDHKETDSGRGSVHPTKMRASETDPSTKDIITSNGQGPASSVKRVIDHEKQKRASFSLALSVLLPPRLGTAMNALSQETLLPPRARRSSGSSLSNNSECSVPLPLHIILSNVPASHLKFFDMLDAELAKVETFYAEREKQMHEHDGQLRMQLKELGVHREMFYKSSAHLKAQSWIKRSYLHVTPICWFLHVGTKPQERHPTDRKNIDPNEYQPAKRRLRKAVTEHYRGLEVLNRYRILNLAGFRKVLKKYEKVTKITVLEAYMQQRVESSSFASGTMVAAMLKETELHFTMRFARGDRRKARGKLRVGSSSKTRHLITFRSGLWLGLAIPAIAGGTYLSFQGHTRRSLPSWNILLYIYSILVVPVLLSLLIGINILVWTRKRISYDFIFELNPRSRLDHYEYFELPSLFLCTLAYAYWFSLAQIGPPILWPLIWLAFTLVVMINPIRGFMSGRARWWAIKNIAKLGACGLKDVRFTDVWLGDQCCSLVYTLSSLYFVGCFYTRFTDYTSTYGSQVQEAWSTCSVARNWRWYCVLGMLPFVVRFMQSLRRYWDSVHSIHLINAGKYMMAIIYYFCYFYWRQQDSPHAGRSYILWCFTAIVNSIYGCAWDFLMDWSVCRPHARYPLLRRELVFKSHVLCYYFALISNLCLRFTWLSYILFDETNTILISFVVALLEMLRRVQWNIYRLENQHLGNMDRYQVTREIPLPYKFDVHSSEDRISG